MRDETPLQEIIEDRHHEERITARLPGNHPRHLPQLGPVIRPCDKLRDIHLAKRRKAHLETEFLQ